MINEQDIAQRCRRGDRRAQQLLYETYADYLFGVCLRYVVDRTVAEDLLHEGFIKAFTQISTFRYGGAGSLRSWLSSIMRNVAISHLRKRQLLNEALSLDEYDIDIADEPNSVSCVPDDVLAQMIASLPVGYRTVFNMFVIDGCTHREIAKALGIKERSSSSQLLRARKLLAQMITEWIKRNNR